MAKEITKTTGAHASPFERIKRASDAGVEYWSSRDFAEVLGYGDYRNFMPTLGCSMAGRGLSERRFHFRE